SVISRNAALVEALKGAQAAGKAGRFAEALAKAKDADAIQHDKPAALNPVIHNMIIRFAIAAKDYATAMSQIEANIASGEGNNIETLKQAVSVARLLNDEPRTKRYSDELIRLG